MIERFNFYDVYGYLVPGFALFLVFSIPYFAAGGEFPFDDLADAVVVLVAAYIAGHLVQIVAAKVLPVKRKVKGEAAARASSDLMLDLYRTDPESFDPKIRNLLRVKILEKFGVDIEWDGSSARNQAFRQARNLLMASEKRSYAEQFQGMYSMMRGLCCAAAAGFLFDAGWLAGSFLPIEDWFWAVGGTLLTIAIIVLFRNRIPDTEPHRSAFVTLLAALIIAAGAMFAPSSPKGFFEVATAAAVSALCTFWTSAAYRRFADEWVKTVYLDFLALG